MNAQKVLTDDVNNTDSTTISTAHGHDEEVNHLLGGFSIDYLTDGDANGVGFSIGGKYFVIDGNYVSDSADGIEASSWMVSAGGHYRYWFNKRVFAEGNLGLFYGHSKVKIKYQSSAYSSKRAQPNKFGEDIQSNSSTETYEDSDGSFGLYLTPRIGINLFTLKNGNGISLVAGYRWNFREFKFKKDYIADYFTIGLSIIM